MEPLYSAEGDGGSGGGLFVGAEGKARYSAAGAAAAAAENKAGIGAIAAEVDEEVAEEEEEEEGELEDVRDGGPVKSNVVLLLMSVQQAVKKDAEVWKTRMMPAATSSSTSSNTSSDTSSVTSFVASSTTSSTAFEPRVAFVSWHPMTWRALHPPRLASYDMVNPKP